MASVAKTVRNKIAEFGKNVLFTSKHLLGCGSRNAVDIALWRLVKAGKVLRLTSGVFMRVLEGLQMPSTMEIAQIKAERFSKRLYEAEECKRNNLPVGSGYTFHTDGSRTSMLTVLGRIFFKHRAPAKVASSAYMTPEIASRQTVMDRTASLAASTGRQSRNDRASQTRLACFSFILSPPSMENCA